LRDSRLNMSRRILVQSTSALVGAGVLQHTPGAIAAALAAQEATAVRDVTDPRLIEAIPHIDQLIGELMARDGVPGAALAVTDLNGVLFTREYGYADQGAKIPVEPATRFEFGSIGKTFTSVCMMQLVDEGKVDLHAPVTTYLPWFAVQSDYPPITPHDLLSHTSGLIYGTEFALDAPYEVYALRGLGVSGPPGDSFLYSNVGYKTLGLIIEAVTGKTYRENIQERIFDPLQMTDAANAITSEARKRLAVGYWPWFDDRPIVPADGVAPATWIESSTGDGSLIASASDLSAFLRMLLNGGVGPNGRLISEATFDLMRQPYADMGIGFEYGYALMLSTVDGQSQIGHTGGMLGFVSAMFGWPEAGVGVVVLLNGPGDPITMMSYALQSVAAALDDKTIPQSPALPDPAVIENAAEYAGTYIGDGATINLEAAGDGLDLVAGDERTSLLTHGADTFLVNHPDFDLFLLRAVRNADGKVAELTHGSNWYRGEAYDGPTSFEMPEEWSAFPGHYRSYNPWKSNFRIGLRKGQLWLFWRDGREEVLELTASGFQPTADHNSPLRLNFDAIVEGRALRGRWNDGDDIFYRFFTP
jgi:D-alanyl-D-alanine carboxypeptidase